MARSFLVVVVLAGLIGGANCLGCSSGSSSSGGAPAESDAAAAQGTTGSSVQAATTPATVALQATLAAIDSAFPALGAPPTVTRTGTAMSGTVTVDFGGGTVVNAATVSGAVSVTYDRAGNSATFSLSFVDVLVTTSANGALAVDGSLTSSVTLGGAGTASGTLDGSLSVASTGASGQSDAVSVTFDLSWTASGGALVLSGRTTSSGTRHGSWTIDLASLTFALAAPPRAISAGTISLLRQAGAPVTVTIVFTGPNTGTITTTPPGTTTAFSL